MKLTEEIWNDFLDTAVDAWGKAGWDWFEEKYGLTYDSFEKLLLNNQEKAEKYDILMDTNAPLYESIIQIRILRQENKQLKEENERLGRFRTKHGLHKLELENLSLKQTIEKIEECVTFEEFCPNRHEGKYCNVCTLKDKLKQILAEVKN